MFPLLLGLLADYSYLRLSAPPFIQVAGCRLALWFLPNACAIDAYFVFARGCNFSYRFRHALITAHSAVPLCAVGAEFLFLSFFCLCAYSYFFAFFFADFWVAAFVSLACGLSLCVCLPQHAGSWFCRPSMKRAHSGLPLYFARENNICIRCSLHALFLLFIYALCRVPKFINPFLYSKFKQFVPTAGFPVVNALSVSEHHQSPPSLCCALVFPFCRCLCTLILACYAYAHFWRA